jgi:hypothetical protein
VPGDNLGVADTGDGHGYTGQSLPLISNVSFVDIDLLGCSTPVTLSCNQRQPCTNISFDRVTTAEPMLCDHVRHCAAVQVSRGMARCCANASGPELIRRL